MFRDAFMELTEQSSQLPHERGIFILSLFYS